jgi:hypothetical protein
MKQFQFLWQTGLILLIGIIFYQIDKPYQSIQKSIHSYEQSQPKWVVMDSPDVTKLKVLQEIHWKASPIYSTIEDIFYPFRQWDSRVSETVKNTANYDRFKQQIGSLVKNEKATFIRAKKAYFFAKRRNFNDTALNKDYSIKKEQWLSIYSDLIERKIILKNGTYQTYKHAFVLLALFILGSVFLLKQSMIKSVIFTTLLCLSLIVASYNPIASMGIPFFWLLALVLLITNSPQNNPSTIIKQSLGSLIIFSVMTYSPLIVFAALALVMLARRRVIIKQCLSGLFIFHPLGIVELLGQFKKNRYFILISIVLLALLIHPFSIAGPLGYLGNIQVLFLAFVLASVGWVNLMESGKLTVQKNQIEFGTGLITIWILSYLINPQSFQLVFESIWFPIWLWGGVFMIFLTLSQSKTRPQ